MADASIAPSGGDFTSSQGFLGDAGTGTGDTGTISGDWSGGYDTTNCTVADTNITLVTSGSSVITDWEDTTGSNYRLVCTTSSDHCIQIDSTGCTLDGLIIVQDSTGSSDECVRMAASGGTCTVINSILRCDNSSSDQDGLYAGNIGCTVQCENVGAIGGGRCGFNMQPFSGTVTQTWNLISCTAFNNGQDDTAGDGGLGLTTNNSAATINANAHNMISVNNSGTNAEDFARSSSSPTQTWNLDNCICSDTQSITDRDSGAVNAHENITVVEGNPASGQLGLIETGTIPYDLRLFDDTTDNVAQDDHANATGAGLTIGDYAGAVDFLGTSRPQNTNYDIGMHEVSVAAAANPKGPLGHPLHGPLGGPV